MRRYKHYSFDLWLTLIKSNPSFKEQRDQMFFDLYNPNGERFDTIREIIKQEDRAANKLCETTGIHVPVQHMVGRILSRLGVDANIDIVSMVVVQIQKLFLEFKPSFYDANTKATLEQLFEEGSTISILSNTGFILGETLEQCLGEMGILAIFDETIYSDQTGFSKPHIKMFGRINTYSKYRTHILNGDILHVGDNTIADGASVSVGIPYYQINTNNKSIKDLL